MCNRNHRALMGGSLDRWLYRSHACANLAGPSVIIKCNVLAEDASNVGLRDLACQAEAKIAETKCTGGSCG